MSPENCIFLIVSSFESRTELKIDFFEDLNSFLISYSYYFLLEDILSFKFIFFFNSTDFIIFNGELNIYFLEDLFNLFGDVSGVFIFYCGCTLIDGIIKSDSLIFPRKDLNIF